MTGQQVSKVKLLTQPIGDGPTMTKRSAPCRWDLVGAAVCLIGAGIILLVPPSCGLVTGQSRLVLRRSGRRMTPGAFVCRMTFDPHDPVARFARALSEARHAAASAVPHTRPSLGGAAQPRNLGQRRSSPQGKETRSMKKGLIIFTSLCWVAFAVVWVASARILPGRVAVAFTLFVIAFGLAVFIRDRCRPRP